MISILLSLSILTGSSKYSGALSPSSLSRARRHRHAPCLLSCLSIGSLSPTSRTSSHIPHGKSRHLMNPGFLSACNITATFRVSVLPADQMVRISILMPLAPQLSCGDSLASFFSCSDASFPSRRRHDRGRVTPPAQTLSL